MPETENSKTKDIEFNAGDLVGSVEGLLDRTAPRSVGGERRVRVASRNSILICFGRGFQMVKANEKSPLLGLHPDHA
jgi:hypothetical protein